MIGPRILVAGGLDPTGRAGISRDLAVAQAERVDAAVAATCLTVQDAMGVRRVEPSPTDLFIESLDSALTVGRPGAVKVGLLPTSAHVEALRRWVRRERIPLILDPVVRARSGQSLTVDDTLPVLGGLVEQALVVTPNLPELEALTGRSASDPSSRLEAARQLREARGAEYVLSKGGHAASGPVVDWLVGGRVQEFSFPRLDWSDPSVGRGKGCEVAARVAALVAKGLTVEAAVPAALDRLQQRLRRELALSSPIPARAEALAAYTRTFESLLTDLAPACVPEVGMNLAYAPPECRNREDVIGLAGRVTIAGDSFAVTGRPVPGGPHHTGRIALTANAKLGLPVWVFNHRHHPDLVAAVAEEDHAAFDRQDGSETGTSSMEWMTSAAIERLQQLPGFISDHGMPGKEAMIRVLAHSGEELLARHRRLHAGPRQRTQLAAGLPPVV